MLTVCRTLHVRIGENCRIGGRWQISVMQVTRWPLRGRTVYERQTAVARPSWHMSYEVSILSSLYQCGSPMHCAAVKAVSWRCFSTSFLYERKQFKKKTKKNCAKRKTLTESNNSSPRAWDWNSGMYFPLTAINCISPVAQKNLITLKTKCVVGRIHTCREFGGTIANLSWRRPDWLERSCTVGWVRRDPAIAYGRRLRQDHFIPFKLDGTSETKRLIIYSFPD